MAKFLLLSKNIKLSSLTNMKTSFNFLTNKPTNGVYNYSAFKFSEENKSDGTGKTEKTSENNSLKIKKPRKNKTNNENTNNTENTKNIKSSLNKGDTQSKTIETSKVAINSNPDKSLYNKKRIQKNNEYSNTSGIDNENTDKKDIRIIKKNNRNNIRSSNSGYNKDNMITTDEADIYKDNNININRMNREANKIKREFDSKQNITDANSENTYTKDNRFSKANSRNKFTDSKNESFDNKNATNTNTNINTNSNNTQFKQIKRTNYIDTNTVSTGYNSNTSIKYEKNYDNTNKYQQKNKENELFLTTKDENYVNPFTSVKDSFVSLRKPSNVYLNNNIISQHFNKDLTKAFSSYLENTDFLILKNKYAELKKVEEDMSEYLFEETYYKEKKHINEFLQSILTTCTNDKIHRTSDQEKQHLEYLLTPSSLKKANNYYDSMINSHSNHIYSIMSLNELKSLTEETNKKSDPNINLSAAFFKLHEEADFLFCLETFILHKDYTKVSIINLK